MDGAQRSDYYESPGLDDVLAGGSRGLRFCCRQPRALLPAPPAPERRLIAAGGEPRGARAGARGDRHRGCDKRFIGASVALPLATSEFWGSILKIDPDPDPETNARKEQASSSTRHNSLLSSSFS
jgi:hypothetical protein